MSFVNFDGIRETKRIAESQIRSFGLIPHGIGHEDRFEPEDTIIVTAPQPMWLLTWTGGRKEFRYKADLNKYVLEHPKKQYRVKKISRNLPV